MAPHTICVFPPRSGPCWAFVSKFSHCFERMTNWTFHNSDVCPRCLAANPSLQVFVCLNNWCKDTSIHLLFKHSSINKRCLYRCTSSCHAALVTGCRRKEELVTLSRLMNTMHLGTWDLTTWRPQALSWATLSSSHEMLTIHTQLKDAKLVDPSKRSCFFHIYSCSSSIKVSNISN